MLFVAQALLVTCWYKPAAQASTHCGLAQGSVDPLYNNGTHKPEPRFGTVLWDMYDGSNGKISNSDCNVCCMRIFVYCPAAHAARSSDQADGIKHDMKQGHPNGLANSGGPVCGAQLR